MRCFLVLLALTGCQSKIGWDDVEDALGEEDDEQGGGGEGQDPGGDGDGDGDGGGEDGGDGGGDDDDDDGGDGGDDGGGGGNRAPEIDSVSLSPSAIYVDGPVSCEATFSDPDGDDLDVTYSWRNVTRDTSLGSGETIELSPSKITPGETLQCAVTVEDPDGETASDKAQDQPICGLYDLADLDNIDLEINIYLRPYVTDDLEPGYGGEPWDWDGDIPDEIFEFADALSYVLDIVTTVYPEPTLLSAEEALEQAIEIGELVDEYAPVLLESTVPPDPDLFPYLIDPDGYITTYWDEDKGGLQWEDAYEVGITASGQDFYAYDGLGIDLEDLDVSFDDNMGDYLDQGDDPLLLWWPIFAEGAYCTSTFYNPSDDPQESDNAYIPSSILWMSVTVN